MTLKEISRQTGVSISTVSRILSGVDPKCASEPVREKVWEVARVLQYVPNKNARALQSGNEKKEKLRVDILHSRSRGEEINPYFQELIQSISEEVIRLGNQIGQVYSPDEFLSLEKEKEPTGVIVIGRPAPEMMNALLGRMKNIICVGLNPFQANVDRVICDGNAAAEMAMQYLFDNGHRRIGYVGECQMEIRYRGYRAQLKKRDIFFDPALVYETVQSVDIDPEIVERILATKPAPTALFCANDATAIGLLSTLRKLKPKGQYPSIIAIDNTNRAQDVDHLLTTINVPIREMGRMSVKILLDRIEGNHFHPVLIQFPCALVRRMSS